MEAVKQGSCAVGLRVGEGRLLVRPPNILNSDSPENVQWTGRPCAIPCEMGCPHIQVLQALVTCSVAAWNDCLRGAV